MFAGGKLSRLSSAASEPPITVIEPRRGWQAVDVAELIAYRDLFWFLTYRAIRTRYAQSALGIGWAVIQPVASMIVYTIIFGKMVKVQSDGAPYALFSFVALVPWTYFQSALGESVQTLANEQRMISKIYFPRLLLPMSRIVARLLDFGIALLLLVALLAWYGQPPNAGIVMLPVLSLIMIFTVAGAGLGLSALSVQYRDINYGMSFLLQLLMYAVPVVYSVSLVPDKLRIWYGLNPMVGVIEGFRSALLGTAPMPWDLIVPGGIVSMVLLVVGAMFFRRRERVFADVV
jgi:lipopolysaccharide transport system permease protein